MNAALGVQLHPQLGPLSHREASLQPRKTLLFTNKTPLCPTGRVSIASFIDRGIVHKFVCLLVLRLCVDVLSVGFCASRCGLCPYGGQKADSVRQPFVATVLARFVPRSTP